MERLTAGFSRERAAVLLGVTVKTVGNWEAGRTTIPYSAFKLLRILGGYALPGPAWEGFYLRGDTLWSPEGKAFQSYDLAWWGLTVAMARSFRDRQRSQRQAAVLNQPIAMGQAVPPCAADRREATPKPVEATGALMQNRSSAGAELAAAPLDPQGHAVRRGVAPSPNQPQCLSSPRAVTRGESPTTYPFESITYEKGRRYTV